MFLGVTDGHLGLENPQELLLHIVSAKPNGGDHRRQFWRLELHADIVDQVDQMFFVFFDQHFREAVLVALKPNKTGDFVPLILVPRHNLVDVGERLTDAFNHELVLGRLEFITWIGAPARRRTEIKTQ